MTLHELAVKVRLWDQRAGGSAAATAQYSQIFDQLYHHALREWRVYLPAEHSDHEIHYMDRLARWVGNLNDESDQKLLLEYASQINFFSHEDFIALYRTAFQREVTPWIASQIGATLANGGNAYSDAVDRGLNETTWFCPITDSLDINEFYKVNHLRGIGHRPTFATLQMLSEDPTNPLPGLASNVIQYMTNRTQPLERLVLLEDIVGSGTQCLAAVNWAVAKLHKPVLFVPLILCPNGRDALRNLVQLSAGRLEVRPVIELRRADLLGPERQAVQGIAIATQIEDLARRCAGSSLPGIDPFGFSSTGCSIATFSNTPDNTLPIVHHQPRAGTWSALFPRVFRD